MPLDPRADERYHRIPPPDRATREMIEAYRVRIQELEDQIRMLRQGLQQIVEEDYPAMAGDAGTWAAEVLGDLNSVNWEQDEAEGVDG